MENQHDHILVRLAGFSVYVVPASHAPIGFDPANPAHLTFYGNDVQTPFDIAKPDNRLADVSPGPEDREWWLQTSVFEIPWPAGFTVHLETNAPGFCLMGQAEHMIYLQGPIPGRKIPNMESVVAKGQRLVQKGEANGIRWAEVAYRHDGKPYAQFHNVFEDGGSSVILTLQCPEPADQAAIDAAWNIACRWRRMP